MARKSEKEATEVSLKYVGREDFGVCCCDVTDPADESALLALGVGSLSFEGIVAYALQFFALVVDVAVTVANVLRSGAAARRRDEGSERDIVRLGQDEQKNNKYKRSLKDFDSARERCFIQVPSNGEVCKCLQIQAVREAQRLHLVVKFLVT